MASTAKNSRFHFVLDKKLYNKLETKSKKMGISISVLIKNIWTECRQIVERADFMTQYADDWMFGELGLSMENKKRIKIDPEFKKQLFMIQDHYQLRSKAEILRFIIRYYFKKIEKYGVVRFHRVLERFVRRWVKIRNGKRVFKKMNCDMDYFYTKYTTYLYDTKLNLRSITFIGT